MHRTRPSLSTGLDRNLQIRSRAPVMETGLLVGGLLASRDPQTGRVLGREDAMMHGRVTRRPRVRGVKVHYMHRRLVADKRRGANTTEKASQAGFDTLCTTRPFCNAANH